MTTFRIEIDRVADKKVFGLLNRVVRETALSVDAQLKQQTPFDTGRAAGNWIPSIDQPSSITVEVGENIDLSAVIKDFKNGSTIFLTNNLPYIRRLNEGYSKKAPSGYVDDIVDTHQRIAKQKARDIGRGL